MSNSISSFVQHLPCIHGPSNYGREASYTVVPSNEEPPTSAPPPTATYLATWKGDTERNVYATQMPQVMDDATYEANKQTVELFLKNQTGIERPTWLDTKKPEQPHSHEHDEENQTTGTEPEQFQTEIKQFYETFKTRFGEFAAKHNLPIVQADHQGFDYDVIYMQGMEQFVRNAQKAGLKFPKEVSTLSYKQNEQLKSVRSGMNALNDADKHTGPNRAEINSRMATEKQLAIYSNMYHHAAHVLKTQSSELAALLAYDTDSRSLLPSPTFKEALLKEKNDIKAFLQEHAPSLNIKALSGQSSALDEALCTFKPNLDTHAETGRATEEALTRLLNQIFAKTPLLQDTVEFAKLSVLEEATQAKTLNTLENRISINSGSSYLEKTDNGFRLNQLYGQHNGKPCTYELIAKTTTEKTTYTLNRIDAEGNKTALQNINQLSGDQVNLETLKSYFFKSDINDLFGEKQINLPTHSSFGKLAARIKTQEVLNQKIESRLNQELKEATKKALDERNIVSIQGTGFSYNAGLYGENQALDSRSVMTSVLFDLAQEGKVALHGSCGFQQNAIWNLGGNITALQDTTGKTYLADPNHGNDPFTVEEKKSYQATKRFTTRFGMYENKVNGQWEKRNHEPLRVEFNINEGEEIRSIPVYFKGQPVIGLVGYQQTEQLTQADQQTVTLTKAWDQEAKIDGDGQPIKAENRSTITLRYNQGKRAYEIQEIKHWQAVPLANPENPAELLMKGNDVQFGYEEVTQTGADIDPTVLVDSSFDPINCVHSQNGLGAPSENEHLGGNLEIVGTSVLGNDKTHGRSTILAASKKNFLAHPVAVDPNTKRETMISEALEMRRGNLVVGTFNQHHSDMHMHEGHQKTNPYDKDHTAYIDEKDKGNRHGNASVTQTGMLLKDIQALNKKIEGLKAGENTQIYGVDKTPLLKPTELKDEDKAKFKARQTETGTSSTKSSTSLRDLLDDETNSSGTNTSSSASTSRSSSFNSTSSSFEDITVDEMFGFPLKGKTADEIIKNLQTNAAAENKIIPAEILKNIKLILENDAWKDYTTAQGQADQAHTELIALADNMNQIQEGLSKPTNTEMTELQKNSDQRRFRGTGRGKDGWAQGAGLTAGVGGTGLTHSIYSAIEQAGHVAETVGQIATVVDSVLPFGVLLALAGMEGFKNAAFATRRLNQVTKAYKAEHAACLKTIKQTKIELNKIYTKSRQKKVIESTILQDLKKTEQTLQNRINKINQDLQQNLVSMVASPMLPVASVATAVGSAAKLAGATAAGSIAGIVGGAALTAYGAIQTANAFHVLRKTNKVTRAISDMNYGVDSGVRRNFNIYHQQRRNALKFKVANWGAFTVGSAMLVAGSAATLTGVGAAVGLPLSIAGGLMVAGSVVTGVIDPKREWRGKTGMGAEDTVHLQGDFLSTGRRRNRLIHALNNQIGMWGKTMGNIVDHALTSNKPSMKNFSRRFNLEKTLRWFSPNYHMRALAHAMTAHPEEVKDHQFNLMLRTTLQEINFVNFKVDELQTDVDTLKLGLAESMQTLTPAVNEMLKKRFEVANANLEKAKQQQKNLQGLLTDLHAYEPEIGRNFRPDTHTQFDHLRVKYMLAHDLLADGLHRRNIRKLVSLPSNNGHVTAVIGNNIYNQGNGENKVPSGKVRSVAFKNGDDAENFIMNAIHSKELGPKLDINRLFARVMCESLPARINYELAAVYNVHMEDLAQQASYHAKTNQGSESMPRASKIGRFKQWAKGLANITTAKDFTETSATLFKSVKGKVGFINDQFSKLTDKAKHEWKNMRENGWLEDPARMPNHR